MVCREHKRPSRVGCGRVLSEGRLGEEWRAIALAPEHVPKIILGELLSGTLAIKIARLVLMFKGTLIQI